MIPNKMEYIQKASKKFIDADIIEDGKDPVKYPTPSYIVNTQHKEIPISNMNIAEIIGLPLSNDWFCGRTDELSIIENNYRKGSHIQILYGMGGMGKTQTALKYAYSHLDSYSLIHWVNGDSIESITKDYELLLSSKHLLRSDLTAESIRQSYIEYMDSHSDWLIIYDNCNYYTDSAHNRFRNECLPKNINTGHIIITSRSNRAIGKSGMVEINQLSMADSIHFILQRTKYKDEDQAKRLAIRLGRFPLAMEIAGAYISATPNCTISQYLSYLDKDYEILDKLVEVTDYNTTIKDVVLLTLERVKKDRNYDDLSYCIEDILHLASYGNPYDIDIRIYSYLLPYGDSEDDYGKEIINLRIKDIKESLGSRWNRIQILAKCCQSDIWRDEITRILIKYGLAKKAGVYLSMHELQQEIICKYIYKDDSWFLLSSIAQILSNLEHRRVIRKKSILSFGNTFNAIDRTIENKYDKKQWQNLRNAYLFSLMASIAEQLIKCSDKYTKLLVENASVAQLKDAFAEFDYMFSMLCYHYCYVNNKSSAIEYLETFLLYVTGALIEMDSITTPEDTCKITITALNAIHYICDSLGIDTIIQIDKNKKSASYQGANSNYVLPNLLYYLYSYLLRSTIIGISKMSNDKNFIISRLKSVLTIWENFVRDIDYYYLESAKTSVIMMLGTTVKIYIETLSSDQYRFKSTEESNCQKNLSQNATLEELFNILEEYNQLTHLDDWFHCNDDA